MRQLNSGFQTPLNYTLCLSPLLFQMCVLKAHQGYLVRWAPFKQGPPAHSFLSFISWGKESERETEGNEFFSK